MRISDGSSDVCSSALDGATAAGADAARLKLPERCRGPPIRSTSTAIRRSVAIACAAASATTRSGTFILADHFVRLLVEAQSLEGWVAQLPRLRGPLGELALTDQAWLDKPGMGRGDATRERSGLPRPRRATTSTP